MLPVERHHSILELLMENKSISVKMLCDKLEASEATIRRDLAVLEAEGKLERTRGGAIIKNFSEIEYEATFYQKETLQANEKMRIAQKAFEVLEDHDTVALDAGTTTLELAKLIGKSKLKIEVITNSTMISRAISDNSNAELFVIGGHVRLNTLATVGSLAIETIKRFNVKKSFIGINGITLESGLTTPDFEEAEIKRAILSAGRQRFVLADYTKFNHVAKCQIAPISMIDYIITDDQIEKEDIVPYETNGISVILG